jgi:hypothetical protein
LFSQARYRYLKSDEFDRANVYVNHWRRCLSIRIPPGCADPITFDYQLADLGHHAESLGQNATECVGDIRLKERTDAIRRGGLGGRLLFDPSVAFNATQSGAKEKSF